MELGSSLGILLNNGKMKKIHKTNATSVDRTRGLQIFSLTLSQLS